MKKYAVLLIFIVSIPLLALSLNIEEQQPDCDQLDGFHRKFMKYRTLNDPTKKAFTEKEDLSKIALLAISTNEGTIYVDGKDQGYAVTGEIRITPGVHKISFYDSTTKKHFYRTEYTAEEGMRCHYRVDFFWE